VFADARERQARYFFWKLDSKAAGKMKKTGGSALAAPNDAILGSIVGAVEPGDATE
jgi:hypothetical protein